MIKKEVTTKQPVTAKYFYALGRRKTAIAKGKLFPGGTGAMTVNGIDYQKYFTVFNWRENLELPFSVVGEKDKYNVELIVTGGGPNGQSEACRLAIARALLKVDETYKKTLRAACYLTRDPRAKERKKPGLKRARRAPQWAKR